MSILTHLSLTSIFLIHTFGQAGIQIDTLPVPSETPIRRECLKTPPPLSCMDFGPLNPPPPPAPGDGGGIHNLPGIADFPEATIIVPQRNIMENFRPEDFNIEDFSNPMQLR